MTVFTPVARQDLDAVADPLGVAEQRDVAQPAVGHLAISRARSPLDPVVLVVSAAYVGRERLAHSRPRRAARSGSMHVGSMLPTKKLGSLRLASERWRSDSAMCEAARRWPHRALGDLAPRARPFAAQRRQRDRPAARRPCGA